MAGFIDILRTGAWLTAQRVRLVAIALLAACVLGAGFLIARDYTTSNTFVWTPTLVGNYDLMVDVRNVGSTALREAFTKLFFYQIQ